MLNEPLIPDIQALEVTTAEESLDLPLNTCYFSLSCRDPAIAFRFAFVTGQVAGGATEAFKFTTVQAGGSYNSPEKFSAGGMKSDGTSILQSDGKLRIFLATVSGTGIIELTAWYKSGKVP